MGLGHIVFSVVVTLWVAMDAWLLVASDRSPRARGAGDARPAERLSKFLMVGGVVVGMAGVVPWHAGAQAAFLAPFGVGRWLGLSVLCAGIAGRVLAVRALGRRFTVEVRAPRLDDLRTDGLFRVVRHPAYAAELLVCLGVAIVYAHPLATPVAILAPAAGILYRIRVEERVLTESLGEPYQAYRRTTKRLVPFFW